jgi:hypothetical protein
VCTGARAISHRTSGQAREEDAASVWVTLVRCEQPFNLERRAWGRGEQAPRGTHPRSGLHAGRTILLRGI